MKVIVGIPAYNEERTIAKIVLKSLKFADTVLVVDDGSHDDTALIAEGTGATVIQHERNLGKGAAIRDCLEWAKKSRADVLVTIDADGQHDPTQIPMLLEVLRDAKADVVIGSRISKPEDMSQYRWIGGRVLDSVTRVKVGNRIVDAQSGFRAYSRTAVERLVAAEYGMGVDTEVIRRARDAGMKIIEVPVAMKYSGLDTSSHNSLIHGLDVIFSAVKFTSIRHPLLFYGAFSIISLAVSLIFGLITFEYYQKWGRVITNLALIAIASGIIGFLALFTGIILFTLITVLREKA